MLPLRGAVLALSLTVAAACGSDDDLDPAAELGTGDHSAGSVTLTVIATAAEGLAEPRDLAFNPLRPSELWVVSHDDDSALIIGDAAADGRTFTKRIDGYALHFFEEVTALAFGADDTTIGVPGTFASCSDSRNTYNGQAPPNDFMGPVLWSSDLSVYAASNPNGLGSHLDMLHNTPYCMGIAHEAEHRYWVFGGLHGSIDRYDFVTDDGIGNDDHLDGLSWRYLHGEVERVPSVPSSLVYDAPTGFLYIADSGHARITRLDTATGSEGDMLLGPETPIQMVDGAVSEDVVAPGEGLETPSGLELHRDILFVSDHGNSRILAYDLDGNLLNYLDTGLPAGSLGGLAFGPDDRLYFVDLVGDRVLRIDP